MSGKGISGLLRNDLVRLILVAAIGAGIVLGIQSLTSGGGNHHAGTQASANGAPSTASAAGGKPASAAAKASGAAAAKGSGKAAGGAGAGATAPGASASTTPVALAHEPVSGGALTLVIDQPSGPFAEQNRLIAQGATIAVNELNAAGGVGHRHVNLVQESLDGLSGAALQARLRAAGPSSVLVLPCDTNSQDSLATAAAQAKQLMLAPCSPDPGAARRIPGYWPVGMSGNDEAAGLVSFLRLYGYGAVFVVRTPGSRYMDLITKYFDAAAPTKSLRLSGEASISIQMTGAEISSLARKIRAAHPPAIFTALPAPFVNRLASGLQRRGVHTHVIGTAAMDTPLTLSSGWSNLEDSIFTSYGFVRQNAAANRFVGEYAKRFHTPPVGSFPGLGYETVRVLEDAVAKAHSTSPAAIGQALAAGLSHTGIGLADRTYKAGDHTPIGQIGVTKISAGTLLPLFATTPSGAPKA